MPLNVTLTTGGASEPVVRNGFPVGTFSALVSGAQRFTAGAESTSETFAFRVAGQGTAVRVSALAVDGTCKPEAKVVQREEDDGNGTVGTLRVEYNCQSEGLTTVVATFEVNGLVVAFSWRKQCPEGPLQGFLITDGRGSPVIDSGRVALNYRRDFLNAFVPAQETESHFFVTLPTDRPASNFFYRAASANPSALAVELEGAAVDSNYGNVSLAPKPRGGAGGESPAGSLPLILRYRCLDEGRFLVNVSVATVDDCEPGGGSGSGSGGDDDCQAVLEGFTFFLRKECRLGPLPGLEVAAGELTVSGAYLVIRDGETQPDFRPHSHTVTLGPKEALARFQIRTTNGRAYRMDPPFVSVVLAPKPSEREPDEEHWLPPSIRNHIKRIFGDVPFLNMGGLPRFGFTRPSQLLPGARGGAGLGGLPGAGAAAPRVAGGGGRSQRRLLAAVGGDGADHPFKGLGDLFFGSGNEKEEEDDDDDSGKVAPPPLGSMGDGRQPRPPPPPSPPSPTGRPTSYSLVGPGAVQSAQAVTNERVLEVSLSGELVAGGEVTGDAQELLVVHDCLTNGEAVVRVTLAVHLPSQGELRKRPMRLVSFQYTKRCQVSDTAHVDVTLGTFVPHNPFFYAVQRGVTTPEFRAGRTRLQVRGADDETTFYVQLPDADLGRLRVTTTPYDVSPEAELRAEAAGTGSSPRLQAFDAPRVWAADKVSLPTVRVLGEAGQSPFTVTDGRARVLVVAYNCIQSGESTVFAQLALRGPDGGSGHTVQWSWRKMCRVPSLLGLNAGTSLLDVENAHPLWDVLNRITPTAHDVISDGKVSDAFSPEAHSKLVHEDVVSFYFYMRNNETVWHERPTVRTNAQMVGVALEGEFSRPGFLDMEKQELRVRMTCHAMGVANVVVTVPTKAEGEPDLKFAFTKRCRTTDERITSITSGAGTSFLLWLFVALPGLACVALMVVLNQRRRQSPRYTRVEMSARRTSTSVAV